MSGYRLRYRRGTDDAVRFATIRYPWPWKPPHPTQYAAEVARQAMPWPDKFEVCEDGD